MVRFFGPLRGCFGSLKALIVVCAILAEISSLLAGPVVSRRSALEAGHVSFPNRQSQQHHVPRSSSTSVASQGARPVTTALPLVNSRKITSLKPSPVAVTTTAASHVRREWIPGHVKHHAYIPAHARNVFIPAVLSTVVVPTSSRRYNFYEDDRYRSHYGGFGVGVDYGGQGAGHGFQVALR